MRVDWMALLFAGAAALMGAQHYSMGHPVWAWAIFVPFVLWFTILAVRPKRTRRGEWL